MQTAHIARAIDPNPSEAQKEAGNYRKAHVRIHGLDIAIENARGANREGIHAGKTWHVRMPAHYGYIKRTEGADGDHVDAYIGPHTKCPRVFIIDQKDAKTGKFDEHKAFLGFATKQQVINTYRKAFSDGKADDRMGHIAEMSVEQFKDWLARGDTMKPVKRATGGRVNGMVEPGNIDLANRPVVHNSDGSISTVRSIGANVGGKEVLLPTVSHDGAVLSNNDAIRLYQMSGKHLGIFDTPENSDAYAQSLHEDQAQMYEGRANGGRAAFADGGAPGFDPSQPFEPVGSAPSFDPSKPFDAVGESKAPDTSISGRLKNMWEKATPGGPLWMAKQAVEGMQGSVQSSADAMSEPTTEEGAYFQNQGREKGPGYAMQAAQFMTPAAPGGTGGIFAAPIRSARELEVPAAIPNREAASEFGINLTKGQSTQDLDRIRYEDMAARGAYGKEAQDRAAAFFQKQFEDTQAGGQAVGQQTARTAPVVDNPAEAATALNSEVADRAARARALQANVEQLATAEAESQRGIVSDQQRALDDTLRGGALPIEGSREAGEVVGQNVRDAAAANRADFRARYDEFGSLPGEFDVSAVRGMGNRVKNELTYGDHPVIIDDHLTPSASRAVQALDEMSAPRIQNRASPRAEPNPEEIASVSLRGVDQMRKQLVAYYRAARSSNNAEDIRATRGIMNAFDTQIESAITENLFSGDPRALQALQEARASYSRYQRTFTPQGAGDDVGTAMRRIVDRNATPEEIANMVVGSGKIGNAGLPVRIADRLEQVLGANSDAWSTIRQAMWQKASQVRNSAGAVDPLRSANSITEFTGSTLAQRMFTAQERAAMRAHAQGVRELERNIEQLPITQTASRVREVYQDAFGGRDLGGAPAAAFKKMVEGTATPEEIANGVFKVIGSGNPGHVTRTLRAIERIVGPESEAMGAVRQGVWQKLTQAAEGKDQPGAQKAMQAINEFLNGSGRTIAQQLYSEKELALMGRYANAIKLTIIPKYARTNSDTAPALLAAVRKYGSMVMGALGYAHGDGGLTGMGVGKLLEMGANRLEGATQSKRLNDSLEDIIPKLRSLIGNKETPSRVIRKAVPLVFGPRSQGVVAAGAEDENKKPPRVGQ
jgi:hypothetical protein